MTKTTELEVCVERADDAIAAVLAGATRIEMNTSLHLDGLTAAVDDCCAFKQACPRIPLVAMVRPHHHSFCYSHDELTQAVRSCEGLLAAGADGIVFGGLDMHGAIDVQALRLVADACLGKPLIFHRAFDVLHDQAHALELLIEYGVKRVLTSGGAATAMAGAWQLRTLREQAAGRIEILPGGGLSADNVLQLLEITGCDQVHGSFRGPNSAGRPDLDAVTRTRQALEGWDRCRT